jgi:hypothetical protein
MLARRKYQPGDLGEAYPAGRPLREVVAEPEAFGPGHLLHWPAVNTGLYDPDNPRYAAHQAKLRGEADVDPQYPFGGKPTPEQTMAALMFVGVTRENAAAIAGLWEPQDEPEAIPERRAA